MFYLFFNDLWYILHRSELGSVEIFKKFAQDSERFAQLFFLQSDCRIYNQIVDFFEPTIVEIYNEIVEKKVWPFWSLLQGTAPFSMFQKVGDKRDEHFVVYLIGLISYFQTTFLSY